MKFQNTEGKQKILKSLQTKSSHQKRNEAPRHSRPLRRQHRVLGGHGVMFQETWPSTENDTQPNYQLRMTPSVCVLNSENAPLTHHCLERSCLLSPCLPPRSFQHSKSNPHFLTGDDQKAPGTPAGVGHMPIRHIRSLDWWETHTERALQGPGGFCDTKRIKKARQRLRHSGKEERYL